MQKNNLYNLDQALQLRRMEPTAREQQQVSFLRDHITRTLHIPFYRELYGKYGITAASVVDLKTLADLPFTTREDIDADPALFGLKDDTQIRDIALTSGTTGEPVIVPYTEEDLQRLAFNEAVAFYSAGVRQGDRVLLTVTLDRCFIAGLAYYAGVTSLGATAIRSGPGQVARQWYLIEKLKPKVILGVPSFLLELGRWGQDHGYDVASSSVTTVITIGEPMRKPNFVLTESGRQLENIWGGKVHVSYGATEFETAFGECSASAGGHVHPELMLVEIADDDDNILSEGQPGEIVVTPLGVKGFPLVRFKTGDIGRLHSGVCSCGWSTGRLGPTEGRLAQRLKYKGTTFYPEAVFYALQDFTEITAAYIEVRSAIEGADDITVFVGCDDARVSEETVVAKLQAHIRVRPEVIIKNSAEVDSIMRGDGGRKPRKFFDFRK